MMSEPTTVDRITVDELTGKLVLLIEEDRPWREPELMHRQLSAKVRHYVRHIRSQEFAQEHGQRPQDTIVRLVNVEPPGDASLAFMGRVGYELSKHGIDFEHQLGENGIPTALVAGAPETVTSPPVPATLPAKPEPTAPVTADERPSTDDLPSAAAAPPSAAEPEEESLEPTTLDAQESLTAEVPEHEPVEATEQPIERAEAETPPGEEDWAELEPVESQPTTDSSPREEEAEEPESASSSARPDEYDSGYEPAVPALDSTEQHPGLEEPSELELLLDSDYEPEFIDDELIRETVAADAPSGKPKKHPPFFPEEEFGRALPDMDDVESILMGAGAEPAIIETSSGQRIRLDTTEPTPEEVAAAKAEGRPSMLRAIGAAAAAALAGAIVWAGLSVGAGHGASPLALAIAVMVGISVRVRGNGHTVPFRLVGVLGTLLGSLLGATLAAAALSAWQDGAGFTGILANLSGITATIDSIDRQYELYDLAALLLAIYVAFKLSASKPPT
jgi:hypothetical protein